MSVRTPLRPLQRAGPVFGTSTETNVPAVSELYQEVIEFEPALRLRLTYPSCGVVVLTATGEIDIATAPRVAALLWPRLLTKLSTVVLDLSGVTFLGVAGLELIIAALAYAPHRDVEFIVVGGSTAVERALCVGGLEMSSSAPRTV
jgi:anti-anti-sigma factor